MPAIMTPIVILIGIISLISQPLAMALIATVALVFVAIAFVLLFLGND